MADPIALAINPKTGKPLTPVAREAAETGFVADSILQNLQTAPATVQPTRASRSAEAVRLYNESQATRVEAPSMLVTAGAALGGFTADAVRVGVHMWENIIGETANQDVDPQWDIGTKRDEFRAKTPSEFWRAFENTKNEAEYKQLMERASDKALRDMILAENTWTAMGVSFISDPLSVLSGGIAFKGAQAMSRGLGISRTASLGFAAVGEGAFLAGIEAGSQQAEIGDLYSPKTVAITFLATAGLGFGLSAAATRGQVWRRAEQSPTPSAYSQRVEPTINELPTVGGDAFTVGASAPERAAMLRQASPEPYVGTVPEASALNPTRSALEQASPDFRIGRASEELSHTLAAEGKKFFMDFADTSIKNGSIDREAAIGVPPTDMPVLKVPQAQQAESALADAGAASNQSREASLTGLRYESQSDAVKDLIDLSNQDWSAKWERLSDRAKAWTNNSLLGTMRSKLSGMDFLMASESTIMKSVASSLGESGSGLWREITSNVAVNKASYDRIGRGALTGVRDEYNAWLKRTGRSGKWAKYVTGEYEVEWNRLLREELEFQNTLNSKTAAEREAIMGSRVIEPELARAAKAWNESMQSMVKVMEEAGMDVAHLKGRNGYVSRFFDAPKLAGLNNTAAKAFRETLARRIKELFDENYALMRQAGMAEAKTITETNALALAAQMVQRAERREGGIGGSTVALFDRAGREELENILQAGAVPKEDIATIFKMLDQRQASKAASNNLKGRMDLDVLKEDHQTGIRLIDYYDNDLSKISTRYIEEMSGRAALHPTGMGDKNFIEQVEQALLVEGKVTGEQLAKEMEELRFMFDQFLGRVPAGQQRNAFVNTMLQWAPIQMLGQVGWAQAAESATAVGRLGVASAIKAVPMLGRMITMGRENMLSPAQKQVMKDIVAYLGPVGESFRTHRPDTDVREMLLAKGDIANMADRAFKNGQQLNGWLSGLYSIMEVQMKLAATEGALNFTRELMNGGALSRRIIDAGFKEETAERIRAQIAKYAKDEQGNLLASENGFRGNDIFDLGIREWDDQKLAREFMGNVERLTGQLVQRDFVGETSKWMYGDMARLAMSMRGYSIKSMQKQLLRNAYIMDAVTVNTFAAASAMSTMSYVARSYVNSIGREDQDEFLEKRLSGDALVQGMLTYHTFGGVLPDIMRAPMSWYRSNDEDEGMRRGLQTGGMLEALLPGLTPVSRFTQLAYDSGDSLVGLVQGDDREVWTPRKIRQGVQSVAGNNIITALGLNLLLED